MRNISTWGDAITLEYGKSLKDYREGKGSIPVFGTNGAIGFTQKALCNFPSVIIGRKGAYRGVHFSVKPFFVIDTAFYIKPRESVELDLKYCYYHLKTVDINGMDSGSAIPSTSREDFYNLPLDLPSLPTQKAIAEILSSLDDKVELNNQINQNLEALAQALFKQWFVDFEFPNENGEPYKSSDGEMIDSELGEIPKGWRVGEFGELVKIVNGFAFKSKDFQEFGDSAIIKIKNISGNLVDVENTQFIPDSVAFSTNKKFQIKEGEILIAMTGAEVGKIGITPKSLKRLFLNQRVGKLLPILLDTEMFIYTFFNTFNLTEEVKSRALGSAQPNISSSGIESIKCIVPLSNVIFEFEKCVGNFYPMLLKNWNENKSLSNLRDTLLPKLISGELEVNESLLESTF
jgi:type I restriction enzyme S subunit